MPSPKASKSKEITRVYYLGKNGKKRLVGNYNDESEAREHIKNLRKLYGPYIQVGEDKQAMSSLDLAMEKVKNTTTKRKVAFSSDS